LNYAGRSPNRTKKNYANEYEVHLFMKEEHALAVAKDESKQALFIRSEKRSGGCF
jgi:hypothetical protein